jgi:hypothetical protein
MRALVLAAWTLVAGRAVAECTPTAVTARVRVRVEPPEGIEVAGVVTVLTYPADKLTIAGRGPDAGRKAVSALPAGAATASDDLDGELRQVVAQPTPLWAGPLFEVTFHRCEGGGVPVPSDLLCRVIDASDPKSTKVTGTRCAAELL